MAVVIPNDQDNPSFIAMSVRDRTDDFAARSNSLRTGVLSGMVVTGTGASVAGYAGAASIGAGSVAVQGTTYAYGGGTVNITSASVGDHRDAIIYSVGTGVTVLTGNVPAGLSGAWTTSSTTLPPVKPYITEATDCVLSEAYANYNASVMTSGWTGGGNIVDKTNVITLSAPLVSPAFTGTPTAPTGTTGDNTTQIATDQFVTTAVNNAIAGVNPAVAVSAATIAASDTSAWTYANGASGVGATFTGPVNTAITVDGVTFTTITTQSLLIKNDTQSPAGAFNGIYVLTALQTVGTGAVFTRRSDYNQPSDINNTGAIPVVGGTANGTTSWVLTSNVVTVGTSPLTFAQFTLNPTTVQTGPLTGDVTTSGAAATVVPQSAISRGQDVTARGGAAGAGSLFNGVPYRTTAGTYAGVAVSTIVTASVFNVAAAIGGGAYYGGPGQITVVTNGSPVVLSYTGTTATSYTGLALVSGSGSATVTTGAYVTHQPFIIADVFAGCSIARGDGGVLGTSDWATLLNNTENTLAGLVPQNTGWVYPVYSDGAYGGLQWATNSGSGVTTVTTGSPAPAPSKTVTAYTTGANSVISCANHAFIVGQSVTITGGAAAGTWTVSAVVANVSFTINNGSSLGAGGTTTGTAQGTLGSSINITSASTIVGDTRTFRRVIIFGKKQTTGDGIAFATTGKVVSSGTIDTSGSGLFCWDSGDLGGANIGTGFTATWHTHVSGSGSGGVTLLGALYIQNSGQTGSININLSKGATTSSDWASYSTGLGPLLTFLSSIGMPVRRAFTGDQNVNDALSGYSTYSQAATNVGTTLATIQSASPLTEIVCIGCYNCGNSFLGVPGVGNSTWSGSWIPALRSIAITKNATFVDAWARFGDLSNSGDAWGLTEDNIHMGIPSTSYSGRNGQQALAELFFEKLAYSQAFALSGQVESGLPADGAIKTLIAVAEAGGTQVGLYINANDADPAVALYTLPGFNPGLIFGLGGSNLYDTGLTRSAAGVVSVQNAIVPAAVATTVTSNAGSVAVNAQNATFTNSSAAAASVTLTTTGATDGQTKIVRFYDFSAAAEPITWFGTEASTVALPTLSNGSTSLPLTVGFQFNASTAGGHTPAWRCLAWS